jgi:hypothetical protein
VLMIVLASPALAGAEQTKKQRHAKVGKKSVTKAKSKSKPRGRSPGAKKWRSEWPADYATTPAYRYSTMSPGECEAELTARKIPFVTEQPQPGVLAPVRLTGTLHGVEFRTNQKAEARKTSIWEIADCRLVLALDDFAEVLAAHDVVDVRHYSMHRSAGKNWPADKPAMRHAGGLAIDAARFIKKDGTHLDVLDHFHGRIGAKTCGEGAAPNPVSPEATELRAILCEAAGKRLFNVILTPNYNRPHRNHFHMEVTAGWKSFNVH